MKSILAIFILMIGTCAFASGPSTDAVDVDTMGLATASSDIVACQQARVKAINDAPDYFEGSQWTYAFGCMEEGEDINDVIVKKSSCTCEAGANEGEMNCLYEATVVCYETVWYD